MKTRVVIIWLVFIFLSTDTLAQQSPTWSSFYESGFLWNPALTARWNSWEVSSTVRQEWSGFDDAPQYSTIGFQYPFVRNIIKITVGGFIEMDKVGPYESIGAGATYGYKIYPELFGQKDGVLTFGLSARINQFRFNANDLVAFDGLEGEINIPENGETFINPNVGVGVFYNSVSDFYAHEPHFFFGASFNNLIPIKNEITPFGSWTYTPHVHLHGGARLKKSRRSTSYVEPSLMISYALDKTINIMAHVRYEKEQKYWASIGGVSNGEVFAQLGLIFNDRSTLGWLVKDGYLRIGTKVDYSLGAIGQFAGMGYEAFVAYSFSKEPN